MLLQVVKLFVHIVQFPLLVQIRVEVPQSEIYYGSEEKYAEHPDDHIVQIHQAARRIVIKRYHGIRAALFDQYSGRGDCRIDRALPLHRYPRITLGLKEKPEDD